MSGILTCVKCNYKYMYPSWSNKYCGVTCAIRNDDIEDVKGKCIDLSVSSLLYYCVSVEMVRLICKNIGNDHKEYLLRNALITTFDLANAKVVIDEIYVMNYCANLTDRIAYVAKAEIAQYIINTCPTFDVNVAADHVVARFTTNPKIDFNVIFRTTMYLLNAGANISIFPHAFIDMMLKSGYAQVLAFVPDVEKYSNAVPHIDRRQDIQKIVENTVSKDVDNIIMSYVGYDTPVRYTVNPLL